MLIEHAIASFFASAAFGIIYQAPRNTIIECGLVGMIGWVIYISLVWEEVDSVPATLIAFFVIAMVSQMLARIYKTPMIIFSVPGIILSYQEVSHMTPCETLCKMTTASLSPLQRKLL